MSEHIKSDGAVTDEATAVFDFRGGDGTRPLETLKDAIQALHALRLIMCVEDREAALTEASMNGVYYLMEGVTKTIEDVSKVMEERIGDPYHKGYVAGSDSQKGEWRRGYNQGRLAALFEMAEKPEVRDGEAA